MRDALAAIVETERTPLGMVMRLGEDKLRFAFDSAQIRDQDRELLSRIAGVLLSSHGYRLYIDGHTDDQGPAIYNKDLSLRRAAAVRDYFVAAGIPKEVIEVRGFGESNPRVQGTSQEARRANRRVEIGLVDAIIEYDSDVEP
jgi:outer membrane protein OmpA-like peptidoglycan-associated protein